MPLPSPSGKEKRSKFISRCVSELARKDEGKDAAQRVAICNSRFRKSKAAQIQFSSGELEVINALIKLLGAEEYSGDTKKKKKKKKELSDG